MVHVWFISLYFPSTTIPSTTIPSTDACFIYNGSPIKLMFLHSVYRTKAFVLLYKNSSTFCAFSFSHEPINPFISTEPAQTLCRVPLSNFHLCEHHWSWMAEVVSGTRCTHTQGFSESFTTRPWQTVLTGCNGRVTSVIVSCFIPLSHYNLVWGRMLIFSLLYQHQH